MATEDEADNISAARHAWEHSAEMIFRNASDDGTTLNLDGLRKAVKQTAITMTDAEAHLLFNELDADGDGRITLNEFLDGLSATPKVGSVEGTASLLKSTDIKLVETLAQLTVDEMKRRKGLPSNCCLEMMAVLRELEPEDLRKAWRGAEDQVVDNLRRELDAIREKEQGKPTAQEFNAKFATDGGTFEGVYAEFGSFRAGVEGSLGLPGKDVNDGMKMEFCFSEDSKDTFKTSNYGGTETTPEQEYAFVVRPEKGKVYSGGRSPSPLQIFLYAACARKCDSSEHTYDAPLESLDETTRDGVKTVLLRRVKEVGMAKSFLVAAAQEDSRLSRLARSRVQRLKSVQASMGAVLKRTPPESQTGQPCFEQVAQEIKHQCSLSDSELDGLLASARSNLRSANLLEEEIVALRLYTGPAFMKLNGVLREREVGGKGNNYVCTIFSAISGMVKLAEVSPIPEGRVVYRGQQNMRLPEKFWKGNAQGTRGGVEMAFLSTTTDVEVAMSYAAQGSLATVFAIQAGAVDKGAALGFLSQYPQEDEILMPPRSFLEVVGEPTVEPTERGAVMSIPVKINCNLLCPTLEKLREGRKTMLVSTLEHVRKEITRDVNTAMETEAFKARADADVWWHSGGATGGQRFIESIKDEPLKALEAARRRPAAWYNVDVHFRRAMQEALAVQRKAMGKLQLWLEEKTLQVKKLNGMSAHHVDRKAAGRLRRLIEEAEERMASGGSDAAGEEKRRLVQKLCRHRELYLDEVNEVLSHGETALMGYAAEGHELAVRLLLEARADVEAVREGDRMTALKIAAAGGQTTVVRMLVEEGGAAADEGTAKGTTALMFAASNGHCETVRALLGCRADANAVNKEGRTSAMKAASDGHARVLDVLVTGGGASAWRVDDEGCDALMLAAQNGHEEVVRWLLARATGAVDAVSADGKTALQMAEASGHARIVRLLQLHHEDPSCSHRPPPRPPARADHVVDSRSVGIPFAFARLTTQPPPA